MIQHSQAMYRNGFQLNRMVNNGFHHNHNHHNNNNNHNNQYNNGYNGHQQNHCNNAANRRRRTVSSGETENGHPIYKASNGQQINGKPTGDIKPSNVQKDNLKQKSVENVNDKLNRYRKEGGKYCDFELRVGEKRFPVHKVILSASSTYFDTMFTTKLNFIENETNSIDLQDVDPQTCEMLLNYIYTGEINVNSRNVQDIARISNMLEIMELAEYCSKFLEENLSIDNCIGILNFADFYGFQALCFEAKRFVERYFAEVCKEEEFLELSVSLLRSFLRSENISIDSEYQILSSTLNWILKDDSRFQYLEEFINLIRMPLITPEQIGKLIEKCKHVEILKVLKPYLQSSEAKPDEDAIETYENSIRAKPRMSLRRRIYVLGGLSIRPNDRHSPYTLHTMDKFNIHTGTWDQEQSFFYPRSSHCVVKVNNKIYLIGGECDSQILNAMEIYDPEVNQWTRGPDLQKHRSSFGACVHGSHVYVFGGKMNNNTIERYDPQLNSWQMIDDSRMPMAIYGMQVVEHDGLIYIIGGKCNNQTLDTLFSYDPITKIWKPLASLRMARSDFGCAVLHGNIYAIGGSDISGEPLTTVEQYNITENTWSFLAPLKQRRAGLSAIPIDNDIYVFGGKQINNTRGLKNVDVYNPGLDTWFTAKPMLSNRSEAAVVSI